MTAAKRLPESSGGRIRNDQKLYVKSGHEPQEGVRYQDERTEPAHGSTAETTRCGPLGCSWPAPIRHDPSYCRHDWSPGVCFMTPERRDSTPHYRQLALATAFLFIVTSFPHYAPDTDWSTRQRLIERNCISSTFFPCYSRHTSLRSTGLYLFDVWQNQWGNMPRHLSTDNGNHSYLFSNINYTLPWKHAKKSNLRAVSFTLILFSY
jgi:hypothetical protein